jgi:ABC-type glycerol-3-phosphate transport system permease component
LQAAGSYIIDCGVIMAGAVIAIIPVCVFLTFFVQRYVIEGAAGSGINR